MRHSWACYNAACFTTARSSVSAPFFGLAKRSGLVRLLFDLAWHPRQAQQEPIMKTALSLSVRSPFTIVGLLAGALLAGVSPVRGADSGVVAPGATVQKLADHFAFTEGPACDDAGNVYFTDQPNDRIMRWSIDGKLSTFKQPCGRSNGLFFDKAGDLWACADEKNELWCIGPRGSAKTIVKDFEGKLLNAPNDLWIRKDGGIYFTDPYYPRKYWDRGPSQQSCQGVYFVTPDRKKVIRVIDDLDTPNGLIGTPDGTVLYVADLKAGKTYAYSIEPDGALTHKRLFCELGSDGMTIDNEGNVYLTGKGVTVFNVRGERIKHIPIDARWTANVCFGGKDRNILFITASQYLFSLRMRVRGVSRW